MGAHRGARLRRRDCSFSSSARGRSAFHRRAQLHRPGIHRQAHYEPAAAEFREALGLSQDRLLIQAQLAFAESAAGRPEAARRILDDLTAASKQRYVSPYYFALVHAGLGDTDAAFALLERAYHDRSRRLWALRLVPTWDRLRPDPRFGDLLHRIGLDRAQAAD